MKNKLVLDFRDNPDLKAALGGKQPGDRITLEFEVMVTSVDDETFEADIESITPDSDGEDAETAKTDSDSPVMAVMIARRGGGPSKSKSSDSSDKSSDYEDEGDSGSDEETEKP